MVMIVATLSVSSLAYFMFDRLKYFTTVLTTVSTNPLVSDSSLPLITNSTPESFLYRNTSTQMHTIEYANSVPMDIMSISCSRLKIADIIPDMNQSYKVNIAYAHHNISHNNSNYCVYPRAGPTARWPIEVSDTLGECRRTCWTGDRRRTWRTESSAAGTWCRWDCKIRGLSWIKLNYVSWQTSAYLVNSAKIAPEETIHFTVVQPIWSYTYGNGASVSYKVQNIKLQNVWS